MTSDAGDYGFARSLLEVAFSVKERVVLILRNNGSFSWFCDGLDILLVNFKVVRLDNEAIGWHLVSSGHADYIADDHLPDVEVLHGADLTTDSWKVLITSELLKSHEGFVLGQVVQTGDQNEDEKGNEDGNALNPTSSGCIDNAGEDGEDCHDCNDGKDLLVEGLLQRVEEARHLWLRFLVDAKAK